MNNNSNKGNLTITIQNIVWKAKVGISYPALQNQLANKTETKLWKIKVILN